MSDEWLWDRWNEVDALLERALEQDPRTRDRYLVEACGDDGRLLDLLRRLILLSEDPVAPVRPGASLVRAAFTDPQVHKPEDPDELIGSIIGSYRITQVLGAGGMGTVYLGQRADGVFDRQVAIKVLRRSVSVSDLAGRFRQERQILASLNHAGIARFIDGGVTTDNRAYLVMEAVDGTAIDRYARERQLTTAERVRLVIQAAEAVEHAHRHMVVHRDLKPSNILVTSEGRVKLLDFGIAKLLGASDAADIALTRPEMRFATPEYAAPEQLLGESVSTQTDVYGLSAVLYELVTGFRPWERRPGQTPLERVITGDAPTAPSSLAPELRKQLEGDLDAILIRGLRARAEERYSSVAAFREDLERHLTGQAVHARGDARLYRLRRFVRRHRMAVGATAASFFLISGLAAGLAVQRMALIEERNRAAASARAAAHDAATAREVTALIVDLFRAADPLARADSLTVGALLERGTRRVDSLTGQPHLRAELLDVLGRVHGNLGAHERAVALLSRSVALREDTLLDRAGLASSLMRLGYVHRDRRAFAPAVDAYRRALAESFRTGEDSIAAQARLGMAHAWLLMDHTDSAEVAFREGLAMLASLPHPPAEAYLGAMNGLAGLRRRAGDLAGAADLYGQVIAHYRYQPRDAPLAFATSLNNLAVTRRLQGAHADAVTLYREALDTVNTILGAAHPTALTFAGNLATALREQGMPDSSLAVYERRVAAARERWPQGDWRLAEVMMNVGAQLIVMERDADAIAALTEAVAMLESELERGHSWTAVYRGWLGAAQTLVGRREEGAASIEASIASLSRYDGLAQDRSVTAMIEALIREIEQRGLHAQAARYRELLERAADAGDGAG